MSVANYQKPVENWLIIPFFHRGDSSGPSYAASDYGQGRAELVGYQCQRDRFEVALDRLGFEPARLSLVGSMPADGRGTVCVYESSPCFTDQIKPSAENSAASTLLLSKDWIVERSKDPRRVVMAFAMADRCRTIAGTFHFHTLEAFEATWSTLAFLGKI